MHRVGVFVYGVAGWLLTFWATPTMTATHLLFAVATQVVRREAA